MRKLPPFPINEQSILLIREALDAKLGENGHIAEGEFTMPRLLEFYSGEHYREGLAVRYTRDDIIEALLNKLEGKV